METDGLTIMTKLFPLINATALITLIGLILRHRIANRKTDLEARKVGIEEDEFDRKGWRELIETLTAQVERANAQINSLTGQVTALQTENGQLRSEVRELHTLVEGARRQNLQEGSSAAAAVLAAIPPENIPPATRDALRRVRGDT